MRRLYLKLILLRAVGTVQLVNFFAHLVLRTFTKGGLWLSWLKMAQQFPGLILLMHVVRVY